MFECREFLGGFRQRKLERKRKAQEQLQQQLKEERKKIKQEVRYCHYLEMFGYLFGMLMHFPNAFSRHESITKS